VVQHHDVYAKHKAGFHTCDPTERALSRDRGTRMVIDLANDYAYT
jgi:hypothetical protein